MTNEAERIQELVPFAPGEYVERLDPNDVLEQVAVIQDLMGSAMKDNHHFGVIPGCGDKPTLLKPGAEKLCFMFRLRPDFETVVKDLGKGHREYQVTCTLFHQGNGEARGMGVGSASTMESRYRFRTERIGTPPKEYWKDRDPKLLPPNSSVQKKAGQWAVVRKVEHDAPADYYNTCWKIAKKRSFVDAVITTLACSDIFAQDLEDLPPEIRDADRSTRKPHSQEQTQKVAKDTQEEQKPREIQPSPVKKDSTKQERVTDAQLEDLNYLIEELTETKTEANEKLAQIRKNLKISRLNLMTQQQYHFLIGKLRAKLEEKQTEVEEVLDEEMEDLPF
jgi:hypothetical protein